VQQLQHIRQPVAGDYKVVVTTPSGCQVTSLKVTVTVNPTPVATILQGPAISFCDGSSASLTADTDSAYAFQWLNNGIPLAGETSQSLLISTSGNYSVVETNSFDCSDTSDVTVVTVYSAPLVDAFAPDTIICLNDEVTLSATGATDYVWVPGNLTGPSVVVQPTVTTTYTVTGTDVNGCKADDNITIEVSPLPSVSLVQIQQFVTLLTLCLTQGVALVPISGQMASPLKRSILMRQLITGLL
jgi:hypothetical protein